MIYTFQKQRVQYIVELMCISSKVIALAKRHLDNLDESGITHESQRSVEISPTDGYQKGTKETSRDATERLVCDVCHEMYESESLI